jgi:hypothetical protein
MSVYVVLRGGMRHGTCMPVCLFDCVCVCVCSTNLLNGSGAEERRVVVSVEVRFGERGTGARRLMKAHAIRKGHPEEVVVAHRYLTDDLRQ